MRGEGEGGLKGPGHADFVCLNQLLMLRLEELVIIAAEVSNLLQITQEASVLHYLFLNFTADQSSERGNTELLP